MDSRWHWMRNAEIGSIGTSHAATALSKLLQKEVRFDPIW